MPTKEQLQQRSELIQNSIKEISRVPTDLLEDHIKTIPKNVLTSVLAGAYELDIITTDLIPAKKAYEVAERYLKEAPDRHRDAAADRGSEVHDLAEKVANGEAVNIPADLYGHVESWKQFVSDYDLQFVRTEFTVYSSIDDYAGTGDALVHSGKYPDLGLICLDYKTSESGIWPDISLQLAALRFAEFIWYQNPETGAWMRDTETLKLIKTFWGVQITGRGYKVVPVTANAAIFQVFRAASVIARYRRDYQQLVLGESEFIEVNTGANDEI